MENLLIDLDREIASTRRALERYPLGKGAWQQHDKRTLSALATHVTNIPQHGANILTTAEMDGASRQPQPPKDSAAELLEVFDTGVTRLKSAIAGIDAAKLGEKWTMRGPASARVGVARDADALDGDSSPRASSGATRGLSAAPERADSWHLRAARRIGLIARVMLGRGTALRTGPAGRVRNV